MSEQLTTATPTGPAVRAGELAARLEQANAEVIEFVQACPSAWWAARTPEEGWAVPAAAMHIAFGHLVITTWVHRLTAGHGFEPAGADLSAAQLVDGLLIGHLTGHFASIRAAADRPRPAGAR